MLCCCSSQSATPFNVVNNIQISRMPCTLLRCDSLSCDSLSCRGCLGARIMNQTISRHCIPIKSNQWTVDGIAPVGLAPASTAMQRSPTTNSQQSGTAEPVKEPRQSLSSISSHDTYDDGGQPLSGVAGPVEGQGPTAKVVQAEDFEYVDFAAASYTQSDIEEFKSYFMGKKLPPQENSTSELRAAGFEGPNPWATCVLENYVINS